MAKKAVGSVLALVISVFAMPALSQEDLSDSEPVTLEEARALLAGRCEEGTVLEPSSGFDGKKGERYRACYEDDHELHYERDGRVLIGWWHFAGDKDEITVCRGPGPRQANCRVLRRKGDVYFGVGGSSGTIRYRFETVG